MSHEFSISAGRELIDQNIETGYQRARDNFERSKSLAQESPWLWGAEASYDDYKDTDPAVHQLLGELPLDIRRYRGEEYNLCNDSVSKELYPDFNTRVYERALTYFSRLSENQLSKSERLVTLDFAKQYLLTMFHAVQYPLRTGNLSREDIVVLDRLGEAARSITRAFYLEILGHGNEVVYEEMNAAAEKFADPAVLAAVENANPAHFKAQEMDQPLTIIASSLLATNDYPDTELIYGLPAGGTQHAIVTQLLFELKNGAPNAPGLDFLPISTHSTGKKALEGEVSSSVSNVLRRSSPRGKEILICEDNTNTGTTLSLASDSVTALSPRKIHVSITEFDPRRLEIKNRHPNPHTHIANYMHPDFTTAVGIVPVTKGIYPDAQMRKLAALRRKVHDTGSPENNEGLLNYEQLPEDFYRDFYATYQDVLRYCGDTYGYRNPNLVSASLLRHYTEKGLIHERSYEDTSRVAIDIARAATQYPYTPSEIRDLLSTGAESLDYRPDGPWIREGSQALIQELLAYSAEADSLVTLWTKGDGSSVSNPPHTGLNEQASRFKISGLERSLNSIGFRDSRRGNFVAHPKKTQLLKTKVLPDILRHNPNITDIVIIDDSGKNLAEAAQYIRLYGLHPHVINPYDPDTKRTRLDEILAMVKDRTWGENVAFIVDMDDTLLHESFRKHHQPRNMALTIIKHYPEILEHYSQLA